MRIGVLHPQTAFVHGGAEVHTEALVRALRRAGHEAEMITVAGKWYPATEIVHQMGVWRSLDVSESNGERIDAVIALKFPAYLAPHERKIVWLIHQHRPAYELWDHPEYGDLIRQDMTSEVRDVIWQADRIGLGEAKRILTNSENVRDRLWRSLKIPSEALYHRSPMSERLLEETPRPAGDYVVMPSRLEALKRQSLAIEAMRHVKTDVHLVIAGKGPDERALREQIERAGLTDRVRIEIFPPDDRLAELYLGALGVCYPPFDEDYGYVTIEAMAAERPVVTTADAGGPLEFVTHGVTGLVAEADPRSLADAFDRLYRDPEAARRLGRAGNELVRETVPAWPEVVARLLD